VIPNASVANVRCIFMSVSFPLVVVA
jgi:hypothetical protein